MVAARADRIKCNPDALSCDATEKGAGKAMTSQSIIQTRGGEMFPCSTQVVAALQAEQSVPKRVEIV